MRTDNYYIELCIAPLIGVVFGTCNSIFNNIIFCSDPVIFISKIVDISFIIFGFLLTILALIIQSSTDIKSRQIYPRLIMYNKRIIFVSLILGFYSLIYSNIFNELRTLDQDIKEIFVSVFILLLIWLIIDLIIFLNIFYKISITKQV
ncbi:MAG: hypothetical protein ACO1O6_03825 [Bacteroidota bacterium]